MSLQLELLRDNIDLSLLLDKKHRVKSPLQMTSAELSGEGAFSQVHRITLIDAEGEKHTVALKMAREKADIARVTADYKEFLLKTSSKRLPRVVKSYGIYGLTTEGDLQTIESKDEGADQLYSLIFEIQEALPEHSTQLLALLHKVGLDTVQDGRTPEKYEESGVSITRFRDIYQQVISILADIHKVKPETFSYVEQKELYKLGLTHIVTDESRLDGVAHYIKPNSQLAIHYQEIRKRMLELSELLIDVFPQRLTSIHADAWASNFFMTDSEKGETTVYCIDPGTAPYGDSANDVVFSLADLVFVDVNNNIRSNFLSFEGPHTLLATQLLEEYQDLSGLTQNERREFTTVMPLFYAFKAFVSAIFDAKSDEQRLMLTSSAVGSLELALLQLKNSDRFDFSFSQLKSYAELGHKILFEQNKQ